MNEKQLRADVAKRLKRKDVPDALWDYLKEMLYVEEVFDGQANVAELTDVAKKQLRLSQ